MTYVPGRRSAGGRCRSSATRPLRSTGAVAVVATAVPSSASALAVPRPGDPGVDADAVPAPVRCAASETTTLLPTGVTTGACGSSCSSPPSRARCRRGSRSSRPPGRGPTTEYRTATHASGFGAFSGPATPDAETSRPVCGPFWAIRPTRAASGLRSENEIGGLRERDVRRRLLGRLCALEAAGDADAAAGRDEPRAVQHAVVRPDAHDAAVAAGAGGVLRAGTVAARASRCPAARRCGAR